MRKSYSETVSRFVIILHLYLKGRGKNRHVFVNGKVSDWRGPSLGSPACVPASDRYPITLVDMAAAIILG